jgi:hypothetical protein
MTGDASADVDGPELRRAVRAWVDDAWDLDLVPGPSRASPQRRVGAEPHADTVDWATD